MNNKIRWQLVAGPALFGAIALSSYGCSGNPITDAAGDLCCKDFTIGADMTAVDWGIEGEANGQFAALLQSVGDLSAVANATAEEVAGACQQIAIDLGVDRNKVKATTPDQRAKLWCAEAVGSIKATFTGGLKIVAQPPSCTVDIQAQASCEASCSGKAECEVQPGELEASCEPGKLAVKCGAECKGSCEGSANLAVTCEGQCEGTCEGECQGNQTGGACEGTCKGKCRGTCKMAADANVQCEGECTGECTGEATAPKCKGKYTPPEAKCSASAECKGSCEGSASAKAECRPGSIEIEASGNVSATAIGSLKLNLPKIFAVAEAKGKLIVDAAASVSGQATATAEIAGDLSVKAAACIIPVVDAITKAGANVGASLEASASVVAAVRGGG